MRRPFVAVKRKKRVRNVAAIARKTHAHHIGAKTCRDICDRYLQLAKEAVLAGYEWNFPGIDMKLSVVRKVTGGASSVNPFTKEEKYNVIRLGEVYRFRAESEFVKGRMFKFVPASTLVKDLNQILYNTNQEYRLEY